MVGKTGRKCSSQGINVIAGGSKCMEDLYKASLPQKSSKFDRYIHHIVPDPIRGYKICDWVYLVLAKYRKLASENVRIAFPEWTKKQVRKNGRDHFQTVTANLLCSLVLTQKPHKANSYIDISQLLAAASKIKAAS